MEEEQDCSVAQSFRIGMMPPCQAWETKTEAGAEFFAVAWR